MSIVSLRGIARFVVFFLDFSCGCATILETLCGPDFREYFFLFFFSIFGPVLSTCREGTPVTGFFGFLCLAKRLFWLCFPVVSGQEFLASGWFFSRVCHPSHFWAWFGFFGCGVTHPIFGPGSAFLGAVPWLFWPFFPLCL